VQLMLLHDVLSWIAGVSTAKEPARLFPPEATAVPAGEGAGGAGSCRRPRGDRAQFRASRCSPSGCSLPRRRQTTTRYLLARKLRSIFPW